jgi:predicted ribosome quality control (RQC) complex YloA/Tae2 family protein
MDSISEELERAERAESWRRKGELLKIALPHVERGQREVEVQDLFEPDRPRRTIELDPRLSPAENLERIFRRYKKAISARDRLADRLKEARRKAERLEELAAGAGEAQTAEELGELKRELRAAGAVFPEDMPRRPREPRSGPRRFCAEDGTEILVARNAKQNERLTFSIARGNDYWLHVRGWPGPHVVVRNAGEGEMSEAALLDAAHLAIHFSRLRGTDYAEVAYTQCKNVRRLKGAPAGRVSYADASVLRVRFERRRLHRLLGGTGQ